MAGINIEIGDYLKIKIRKAGYTQEKVAKFLYITQQALSKKLKTGKFTYEELKDLFSILNLNDTEILMLMKGAIR